MVPILQNMGTHMKTTIEVADTLLLTAKQVAKRNGTTVRALVEEGLRRVLSDNKPAAKSQFRLADQRVHGKRVLLEDPQYWRNLEDAHLTERIIGRRK
ncbi:MAG: hypothetical protein ACK5YB_13775 [Burkholderiales bacterium]